MQVITATATFTAGTPVVLSTLTPFAGINGNKVALLHTEPLTANSHRCALGQAGVLVVSTVTGIIHDFAATASGANSVADQYEISAHFHNAVDLSELSADGTTNEGLRVTAYIA